MTFHTQLKELEAVQAEGANKVFTMYLNTDPSDPEQQGGKWRIQVKNGLRNFESYLAEDDNEEELNNFKKVRKKVKKFVDEHAHNLSRGMIVFATPDDQVWFAELVQMRLDTELAWEETPQLDQFKQLAAKFPKTGTILVQQNEIKVLESHFNEIKDIYHYELNLDTENWSEKLGPRKGSGGMHPGATNLQKDNFDKRFEANQKRWYKNIAPKLDKLAKDGDWEKIYLVGEREAAHELEKQMNRNIDEIVHKNMLEHDEDKVLAEVSG